MVLYKLQNFYSGYFFDKYFLLGVPEGGISEVEVSFALQRTGDKDTFVGILRDFNERGLVRKFLERMDDLVDEIPVENTEVVVRALLDFGDELPVKRQGLFDLGPQFQIFWVTSDLLKRMDDPLRRVQILKDAVKRGEGLYSVVYLVSSIIRTEGRQGESIIPKEYFEELKKITLERIRQEAGEGKLVNRPDLAYILHRWRDWSAMDEPRLYVSRIASTDKGIMRLLLGFLRENYSETLGDYFARRELTIYQKEKSDFIDTEMILPKVQSVKQKKWKSLSDQEKLAINAFLREKKDWLSE